MLTFIIEFWNHGGWNQHAQASTLAEAQKLFDSLWPSPENPARLILVLKRRSQREDAK